MMKLDEEKTMVVSQNRIPIHQRAPTAVSSESEGRIIDLLFVR